MPSTNNMLTTDLTPLLDFFRASHGIKGDTGVSIAVVGSSGNMLGRRYGAEIDSKSIVIRVNNAETLGFEADVGKGYPERGSGLVRVGWNGGLHNAVRLGLLNPNPSFATTRSPHHLRL